MSYKVATKDDGIHVSLVPKQARAFHPANALKAERVPQMQAGCIRLKDKVKDRISVPEQRAIVQESGGHGPSDTLAPGLGACEEPTVADVGAAAGVVWFDVEGAEDGAALVHAHPSEPAKPVRSEGGQVHGLVHGVGGAPLNLPCELLVQLGQALGGLLGVLDGGKDDGLLPCAERHMEGSQEGRRGFWWRVCRLCGILQDGAHSYSSWLSLPRSNPPSPGLARMDGEMEVGGPTENELEWVGMEKRVVIGGRSAISLHGASGAGGSECLCVQRREQESSPAHKSG